MDNEKQLSQEESLHLITSMINRARDRFDENGFLYLLWGWGILFCCITQFIMQQFFPSQNPFLVWLAIWPILIYHIIYLRKKKVRSGILTYTDELSGFVWVAFSISIFLALFACGQTGQFQLINTIILLLYGIPVFISGGLLRFRPLIYGGVACWVLSFFSIFVKQEYSVLLVALAIVLAWITPGYLLRIRNKKQMRNEL